MKFKLPFIALILLLTTTACKKEKVGGTCEYKTTQETVSVTFIDGDLSDDFMVSFQPTGVETDEVYRVTKKQFKQVNRNFDLSELQNKDNTFTIKINEITKGTCVPFVVKEIHLDK